MKKIICSIIAIFITLNILSLNVYAQNSKISINSDSLKPKPIVYSNGEDKLKIEWKPVQGASKYAVYRSGGNQGGVFELVEKVSECFYIDEKIEVNRTYYYIVCASIKNENGENSITKSETVTGAVVLINKPIINVEEYGNESIRIKWEHDKNVSYYNIYRSDENGYFIKIGTSNNGIYYDSEALKPNNKYYYKITAVKRLNGKEYKSNYSDVVSLHISKNYQRVDNIVIDNEWAFYLVNKENYLPDDFTMELEYIDSSKKMRLDKRCIQYVKNMLRAAEKDDIKLTVVSSYRSLELQKNNLDVLIQYYVNAGYTYENAYSKATMEIAPPGASEHNAGLALDILSANNAIISQSFDESKEYKWLIENSWKYGFIMRYPKGKENITGYIYEPWHFRFIGLYQAEQVSKSGLCLEEYFAGQSIV